MNRIDKTFQRLRKERRAALIPFLTLGDPDLGMTRELMRAAVENGADLLEIGVPFSDPTADGPVLQKSLEIGRQHGASLTSAFEVVRDFRRDHETPVVLYGYYNPIFHYGPEKFASDAARAGVDGLLVVDLPPDESRELRKFTEPAGVHLICLLAPTSGPDRVKSVLRQASGFLYYVSVTGVTGGKAMDPIDARPAVERIREKCRLPIGVGFGISTPEQAGAAAGFADAVIVGSAIMRLVDRHRGQGDLLREVGLFIRGLKDGIQAARG